MRRLILLILTITLASGCLKEPSHTAQYHQQLVVEGRIEEGSGAIVALSLNIPFREKYDTEDFRKMIVRWAKVTVVSSEGEEVLTGRENEDYPTQYIYTGNDIIGKAGESYALIVEYSGRVWRATTTIPRPIELTDIAIEHLRDSLYTITATLPPCDTPCSIECAMNGSRYYAPTLLGVYDSCEVSREITINRPLDNLYRSDYMTLFTARDSVSLRINTMDSFGFEYWSLWENNVINSLNPIFPAVDNLPTNISNDALGIWAGYGSTYYKLGTIIPEDK